MADKTEFLQAIDDAILDADSLEQFINGSDSETVLTRLSAEYPTLQKALKELFENGGLPATPFATKALMTASTLVDGKYAIVTDDTVNNGLYVKTAGAWIKSGYDPVEQAEIYVDSAVGQINEKIIVNKTGNIYQPSYIKSYITQVGATAGNQVLRQPTSGELQNGTVAIVPIKPNQKYTLKVFDTAPTSTLRVAAFVSKPEKDGNQGKSIYYDSTATGVTNTQGIREIVFTTPIDANYIAICYSLIEQVRPLAMLVEGDTIPDFYEYPYIVENSRKITKDKLLSNIATSNNIFDGVYYPYALYTLPSGDLKYHLVLNWMSYKSMSVILKVEPNTEYTFSSPDTNLIERFNFAYYDSEPEVSRFNNLGTAADKSVSVPVSESSSYTFITQSTTRFVAILLSLSGEKPRVMVNKGSSALPYEPPVSIATEYLSKVGVRTKNSRNLFGNEFVEGLLQVDSLGETVELLPSPSSELHYLVVEGLKKNKVYTISVHEPDVLKSKAIVSVYSGLPSESNSTGILITNNNDKFSSFTFNTIGVDNPYLVAYISSDGYKRKVQLEYGAVATPYIEKYVIPNEYIEKDPYNLLRPPRKYGMFANFNQLYRLQGDLNNFVAYNNPSDVIAEYDSVMSNLNGFITKSALGVDAFGYTIYKYQTNPSVQFISNTQTPNPDNADNEFIKNPKILLSSGMHGNERKAVYGLLQAFKTLMYNPNNDPTIEFIRRNVDISIIPIINNSGFAESSRFNLDGVDINRDFLPNTPKTLESGILSNFYRDNSDADFYIDCHTGVGYEQRFGYYLDYSQELAEPVSRMFQQLGNSWQAEFPEMPQNLNQSFSWGVKPIDATGAYHSQNTYGIKSMILEMAYSITMLSAEQEIKLYSEMVINSIYLCLKAIQQ